jgi:prepilin-type N-terminal cleavage/methylation domain-containing protein
LSRHKDTDGLTAMCRICQNATLRSKQVRSAQPTILSSDSLASALCAGGTGYEQDRVDELAPRFRGEKRWRGFSLLEIVLVLAIIVTLAAIAAPRYAASLVRYQADLAARRIRADIEQAQLSAKAASTSISIEFFVGDNKYEIPGLSALNGFSGSYIVELSARPYAAALVSAEFGGDAELIFNGWGMPDSSGTVILTVGSEQRTVTVDSETGKATVQ